MSEPLLSIRDLGIDYSGGRRSPVRAVDGVSLHIHPGETLGLVGESGSGKSTIGNAVLGLVKPTEGEIRFTGQDITHAGYRQRRALSRHIQVIFQDPYSSLNPSRTIGQTLTEPLRTRGAEGEVRVAELLRRVGLSQEAAHRYPAQFSGGQLQRIAIARALVLQPELVICDEPTSALDLSVQAQVLNLLLELQEQLHLSYLFVSHDIAVVRHLSHRVAVLLKGRIMEQGPVEQVTASPKHPYTQALLAAAPLPDPALQRSQREGRTALVPARTEAEPFSGTGCPFAPRCPSAMAVCTTHRPAPIRLERDIAVACHLYDDASATSSAKTGVGA